MDVILLQRVDRLGQMGDEVKVKPGYARNYLLPQRKAVRATDENRKLFEKQRAQLEAENLSRKSEAEAVADKLDGVTIALIRQAGEAGQLYGSVSARDIADGVTNAGFTIRRQQVVLASPIKDLGLHKVFINLHPEVTATITANVARTEDEAALQLARGEALTKAAMEAEEDAEEAARLAESASEAVDTGDDTEAPPADGETAEDVAFADPEDDKTTGR